MSSKILLVERKMILRIISNFFENSDYGSEMGVLVSKTTINAISGETGCESNTEIQPIVKVNQQCLIPELQVRNSIFFSRIFVNYPV